MLDSDEHFAELMRITELERDAEKEKRMEELERFSLSQREATGKTVSRLTIDGLETGVGGYQKIVLSRVVKEGTLTPFHAMNRGDNVRLTFPEGFTPAFVDGTLDNVEEARVTVAVDLRLPEEPPEGRCVIDLIGSDATYQRMKRALNTIKRTQEITPSRLREVFLGQDEAIVADAPEIDFFNKDLNVLQRQAVGRAFAAQDASVVHGPP
ncbi:MAG: hypothetical protein IIB65_10105, partial [Proteobacteria bacterium]|nr:hypothetical protein [Pseudomonadota bacterium]